MEVSPEHVKAIEKKARKVEITEAEFIKGTVLPRGEIDDMPIPRGVERKVLARYKNRCALYVYTF